MLQTLKRIVAITLIHTLVMNDLAMALPVVRRETPVPATFSCHFAEEALSNRSAGSVLPSPESPLGGAGPSPFSSVPQPLLHLLPLAPGQQPVGTRSRERDS